METKHEFIISDSRKLDKIKNNTIDLVVTSPPYPMIKMWDKLFFKLNSKIKKQIHENPNKAFELMHKELDKVWKELYRVVKPGSFTCINIGDATRNINGTFQLYWNSARIISAMTKYGFINLPKIIWSKPSNSPTKFMGSGMLPKGAYVTLEYEDILIFKKPGTTNNNSKLRQDSAIFFDERNQFYTNIWKILGTKQKILTKYKTKRNRNGAFPIEIPERLIKMYSQYQDNVLDPFLGTGTTTIAAIINGRNSIGIEIDKSFSKLVKEKVFDFDINKVNQNIINRIKLVNGGGKYLNENLKLYVKSNQSKKIMLNLIKNKKINKNKIKITYEKFVNEK